MAPDSNTSGMNPGQTLGLVSVDGLAVSTGPSATLPYDLPSLDPSDLKQARPGDREFNDHRTPLLPAGMASTIGHISTPRETTSRQGFAQNSKARTAENGDPDGPIENILAEWSPMVTFRGDRS